MSDSVGVACGKCGGPVYMETCETQRGNEGHCWVIGSECKRCGERNDDPALICHDCLAAVPYTEETREERQASKAGSERPESPESLADSGKSGTEETP